MDLNICLYCEKLITDNDELSFCSIACRNQESKQETAGGHYHSMLGNGDFHRNSSPNSTPSLGNYELAYHRRPSFSYSAISRRRPSSSLSSSSFNSLSSSSFDTLKYFHPSMMEEVPSYTVYTTP